MVRLWNDDFHCPADDEKIVGGVLLLRCPSIRRLPLVGADAADTTVVIQATRGHAPRGAVLDGFNGS